MKFYDDGFTLIEVLIASLIIFSAISIGSLIYQSSVRAVIKINSHISIAEAIPSIVDLIKEDIVSGKDKGEGRFHTYISYLYTSKDIKKGKNILSGFDEISNSISYGRFNITLKEIKLKIIYNDKAFKREEYYTYKELLWKQGEFSFEF
ncbi:MAG: prepilin-type N-terminal cleavage/methylation domain-containing protein [Desulfobacterales bacterium]|nr:prepilin-type N-terminal cleavage/methylation domain-containing protein [Desulfobacterales bacterium]